MINKSIILYAPNINGLGAKVWLAAKIQAIKKKKSNIYLFVNDNNSINYPDINVIRLKNLNKLNFFYLLFARFLIKRKFFEIHVLGDYPLAFIKNQILYLNQANLINPNIYKYSQSNFMFFLKRSYFKFFLKNTKKIFVQSEFMKKFIEKSYSDLKNKISVDYSFALKKNKIHKKTLNKNKIKILYPSNMYSYKNHKIIVQFLKIINSDNISFYFTCSRKEFEPYLDIKNLHRINYFNHKDLEKIYHQYDAIIFPSLIESLGLPIFEAIQMQMPVIAANLPYSKEIKSKYIKYFNPKSVKSLNKTINILFFK